MGILGGMGEVPAMTDRNLRHTFKPRYNCGAINIMAHSVQWGKGYIELGGRFEVDSRGRYSAMCSIPALSGIRTVRETLYTILTLQHSQTH